MANFVLYNVGRDAHELFARVLRRGVMVRPASGWGLIAWIRVTVGTAEQNRRSLGALKVEIR